MLFLYSGCHHQEMTIFFMAIIRLAKGHHSAPFTLSVHIHHIYQIHVMLEIKNFN